MRLRKFQADSMKEAVAQVKAELGPDAMIVSTRPIRRGLMGSGVEVTAAVDADEGPTEAPQITEKPASLNELDLERLLAPVRSEIRSLKAQLRAPQVDHNIAKELAEVRRELARLHKKDHTPLDRVAQKAIIAAPSKSRILALVGPTGAGKTTTIAKLAARAALGKRQMVAIVSVDTYRVGGEEQIRIFADLIGVPLVVLRNLEQLPAAIDDLAGYARIFVDTAGRSPRDGNAIQELDRALAAVNGLETHLTLPITSTPTMIDNWIGRWSALTPERFLFTKIDEAEDLSELVRAPVRHQRPVSWISTGQRVPEDIEEASTDRLLSLATTGSMDEVAA